MVTGFGVGVEETIFVVEALGVKVGTTPFPLLLGVLNGFIGLVQPLKMNVRLQINTITPAAFRRAERCNKIRVCEDVCVSLRLLNCIIRQFIVYSSTHFCSMVT